MWKLMDVLELDYIFLLKKITLEEKKNKLKENENIDNNLIKIFFEFDG